VLAAYLVCKKHIFIEFTADGKGGEMFSVRPKMATSLSHQYDPYCSV
jgi:hypothetical protein